MLLLGKSVLCTYAIYVDGRGGTYAGEEEGAFSSQVRREGGRTFLPPFPTVSALPPEFLAAAFDVISLTSPGSPVLYAWYAILFSQSR